MSIYKRLAADFSFLNSYNFSFLKTYKHYVSPAVSFANAKREIIVGMDYWDDKMFVYIFNIQSSEKKLEQDLLRNVRFFTRNYKAQVPYVQKILKDWLDNNK